jgi:hypothetical protein
MMPTRTSALQHLRSRRALLDRFSFSYGANSDLRLRPSQKSSTKNQRCLPWETRAYVPFGCGQAHGVDANHQR